MVRLKRKSENTIIIQGKPVPKMTREEKLQVFYEVLSSTKFEKVKTDAYIDGIAMIQKKITKLISDFEARFPEANSAKPGYVRTLQRPVSDVFWTMRSGTFNVAVFRDATGVHLGVGGSKKPLRLPAMGIFRAFNDSAAGDQRFGPGKYCSIIYWDPIECLGRFIQNPTPLTGHFTLTEQNHEIIIITSHRNALVNSRVQNFLTKHVPAKFWLAKGTFGVIPKPTIGTEIDPKRCQLLWKAMLSQTFDKWRQTVLKPLSPFVYNHPVWDMTVETSASLRQSAILGYISTISVFSSWADMTTKQCFQHLRDGTLDPDLLAKWLRKRVNSLEVAIETAVQDLTAFSWFLKKLTKKSFEETFPGLADHVYCLRKRLGGTRYASDGVTLKQLPKVLDAIRDYDWGNWDPQDVRDAAILSTWGCLRISELTNCSHLTTQLLPDTAREMLRINVFDAKSSYKNKIQHKDVSCFEREPSLCAIKAWKRVIAKSIRGKLFRDEDGIPWTTNKLHKKFKGFVEHCINTKILPKGKWTWHMWRVTFLNISYTELNIPIHLCQAVASHRNEQSTHGYVERTARKRKARAAEIIAEFAQDHIRKKRKTSDRNSQRNPRLSAILAKRIKKFQNT